MFPVAQLLAPATASVIAFSLWKAFQLWWSAYYKSPLRHLQGPKGTSIILGNFNEMFLDENAELVLKWVKEYGETFKFKGFLNRDYLLTMDTSAVNHILTHSNDYQKPPTVRQALIDILGEGVFVAEDAQHRRQRRAMNPAFGPAQIRPLTETVLSKAFQLRDVWSREIAKDPNATTMGTRIDVVPWFNKAALDIIGLTGFNYSFHSLDPSEQPSELGEAFTTIFSASRSINILDIVVRAFVPVLRFIPTEESRKIQAAKHTLTQIGKRLVTDAKRVAMANEAGKGDMEKDSSRGRDLLSLLVKVNVATDVPEGQRLSDKDVIAQVPTFLFAGHESTSTALSWAMYAIAQAPEVQKKLRDELLSVDTDLPSMDELMALPYLDAVVKETLRVHAPIPAISRVAMKDDVFPVEKPYVDRHGVVRNHIAIAKGDEVSIQILAMNRSEKLWGPDAHEFKPERWNDTPETVSRVPGIWSHLMTFFGGPRACIGYRLALLEIKAVLFSLVRAFEFELAVPAGEVCSRLGISQRPGLRSDPPNQVRLPLLIRPSHTT